MKKLFFAIVALAFMISCNRTFTEKEYNLKITDSFNRIDDLMEEYFFLVDKRPEKSREVLAELKKASREELKKMDKLQPFEGEEFYLSAQLHLLEYMGNVIDHGMKDYVEIRNKKKMDPFDDERVVYLQKEIRKEYNALANRVMNESIRFCKYHNLDISEKFWKRTS